MDVHDDAPGALHSAHLAQLRIRLRGRGNEPRRVSPDQRAAAWCQRRPRLLGRATPAAGGLGRGGITAPGWGAERGTARDRRRRGLRGARLRGAPAPGGIRRVGDGTARCALRALLLADGPGLSPGRVKRRNDPGPVVGGVGGRVRPRAPFEGGRHAPAGGAAAAGHLSAGATGSSGLAAPGHGEDPVSRPRRVQWPHGRGRAGPSRRGHRVPGSRDRR